MGKLNEIQEQTTQSYGDNSFTTTIKGDTVEFDSAKDSFTFVDPIEVPKLKINGTEIVVFDAEDRAKLDSLQTPMQVKGRVDGVGDLPTEGVKVGEVYLVGLTGDVNFEEYVCVELSGSPEAPVWENLGHVKAQSDWNQNNSNADDFIRNRICYDGRYSVSYLETTTNQYASINNTFDALRPMTAGVYKIVVGDNEETANLQLSDAGGGHLTGNMNLLLGGGSVDYYSGEGNGTITVYFSGNPSAYENKTFKIVVIEGNLVTIDKKYLGFYITGGSGLGSIIESNSTNTASGDSSHAEGNGTTASGNYSHAEGNNTTASSFASHAEGWKTTASGSYSHAEGSNTTASGISSHAEGNNTTASDSSHAEGGNTTASGVRSHAEGGFTTASGNASHTEGWETTANGFAAHAEGTGTTASGGASHAEGTGTTAKNQSQHVFGEYNIADPSTASPGARGTYVEIVGKGTNGNTRSNARTLDWSGNETLSGNLTIGGTITANGQQILPQKQADWNQTASTGTDYIKNKPAINVGQGVNSIIEGTDTTASGNYSHAEGNGTIANNKCQHVFGEFNGVDPSSALSSARGTYVEIVGNGTGSTTRSNARTLDWSGNETLAGNLTIGGAITANGVKTTKITIAGINPADEYMYSEIINASSDVALTRVLASISSTKTDGYVEILYKATTGVTCSAYIDSVDVALTADGAWHKLEQGCNPDHGVEIHVNNSSPVADATLAVISKVYYI